MQVIYIFPGCCAHPLWPRKFTLAAKHLHEDLTARLPANPLLHCESKFSADMKKQQRAHRVLKSNKKKTNSNARAFPLNSCHGVVGHNRTPPCFHLGSAEGKTKGWSGVEEIKEKKKTGVKLKKRKKAKRELASKSKAPSVAALCFSFSGFRRNDSAHGGYGK